MTSPPRGSRWSEPISSSQPRPSHDPATERTVPRPPWPTCRLPGARRAASPLAASSLRVRLRWLQETGCKRRGSRRSRLEGVRLCTESATHRHTRDARAEKAGRDAHLRRLAHWHPRELTAATREPRTNDRASPALERPRFMWRPDTHRVTTHDATRAHPHAGRRPAARVSGSCGLKRAPHDSSTLASTAPGSARPLARRGCARTGDRRTA
jgi:hypothetical protein